LESEESNDDHSNQGKEAGGAQDNIRMRLTKGSTTRAPSMTRPRQAPQGARSRHAPPPTMTRQRPRPPSRPEPTTRAPTETRPGQAPQGARTRRALPPTTTRLRPLPRGSRARRIAARCTAEADEIDEGAHNEGSVDNEAKASAARRAYAACAAIRRRQGSGLRRQGQSLQRGLQWRQGCGKRRKARVHGERCRRQRQGSGLRREARSRGDSGPTHGRGRRD
jgi:hypothetical protein